MSGVASRVNRRCVDPLTRSGTQCAAHLSSAKLVRPHPTSRGYGVLKRAVRPGSICLRKRFRVRQSGTSKQIPLHDQFPYLAQGCMGRQLKSSSVVLQNFEKGTRRMVNSVLFPCSPVYFPASDTSELRQLSAPQSKGRNTSHAPGREKAPFGLL